MQAIDTQDNQFHDGNGTTELGTILPAWWLNQIQAEILSVLTAAKVAPNKAQTNQMLNAINKLIAGVVVNNLTSSNADKPLSALQGKVLSEQISAAVSGSMNLRGQLTTQNLNDLHNTENYGVWQNPLNANATTERNYPTNKAGTLLVLPSAYRGQQVYIPFDEPSIWLRDTRNHATQTTWGQWFRLGDDKLGNSGNQTLNGILTIGTANNWQAMRFPSGNGTWVFETSTNSSHATENSIRFNFKFEETGQTTKYVSFPAITRNEVAAYQSFVNQKTDERVAKSGDTMTGHLEIREVGGYSSVRLHNNGGRETRLETIPAQYNDVVFQLADRTGGTGGFTTYCFPKATERQNIAYQSWVSNNFVGLNGNQTINGNKTFASSLNTNAGINAKFIVKTSYNHDWVGFIANQEVEGKHIYFDGYVRDVCRGSYQIVADRNGRYVAKICVTPEGATNTDRRVVGMTVTEGAVHTNGYGWLHEGFIRAGNGVGQEAGHTISIGWNPHDLRLKATLDGNDMGNIVFEQQLNTKSTVAVLTGKIAHGGTIPLPSGFSQAQCKWIVSMHNENPTSVTWDLQEAGAHNHYSTNIWTDANRVVHCRVYRNGTGGAVGWNNAEANYLIIGVK